MLKKTIAYTDFNGEQQEEAFLFNLTRAELVELEMSHQGGLSEAMKKLIETEDGKMIMQTMKDIILRAYGKRSIDGKRFVKTQELRDEFESTEAYSVLFMELVTNAELAAEFVSGLLPGDLMKEAQLRMDETEVAQKAQEPQETYNPPAEPRWITRREAEAMDVAELSAGLASGALEVAYPVENSRALTAEEMRMMDVVDLSRGLASGRYSAAITWETPSA